MWNASFDYDILDRGNNTVDTWWKGCLGQKRPNQWCTVKAFVSWSLISGSMQHYHSKCQLIMKPADSYLLQKLYQHHKQEAQLSLTNCAMQLRYKWCQGCICWEFRKKGIYLILLHKMADLLHTRAQNKFWGLFKPLFAKYISIKASGRRG